jgi:hypothetical protein
MARGDKRVITVPAELSVRATALAGPLSRGAGKAITTIEVERLAYAIGVGVLEKCMTCASGVACPIHNNKAFGLDAQTKKERARPTDDDPAAGLENAKLATLWEEKWSKAFGRKPGLEKKHFVRIANVRKAKGFALIREAFEGVFASDFHTKRLGGARPNLLAVLADPEQFAAMLKGSAVQAAASGRHISPAQVEP